jgi:hypothetical protein
MGLIRKPLDVDFFIDPKPLTEEEDISRFSTYRFGKQ